MPKFWKVYQPFLCDCHWRCPNSCQDRAHTTCPFWIPVPCVVWTHSRSTTAMFGTIDHAALAILVRGQRVPCKCRPQLRVKQLPTKLSALARLEKHEKKRKLVLSPSHFQQQTESMKERLLPHSSLQSCPFLEPCYIKYTDGQRISDFPPWIVWICLHQKDKEKNWCRGAS